MTREGRRAKISLAAARGLGVAGECFLVVAAAIFFFGSGLGNPIIRRLVVRRVEDADRGPGRNADDVHQLAVFAVTLKGLEIHGLEPAGTEPLFTAEEVQASARSIRCGGASFLWVNCWCASRTYISGWKKMARRMCPRRDGRGTQRNR